MEIKKTTDKAQIPLDDAELANVSGGSTATSLIRDDCWTCPACRTLYSEKKIPRCPKCGYES